jgi:dGTPase
VVESLEQKYPRFAGLNLTWEVREGLAKHETSYDHPSPIGHPASLRSASLEAQVANLADEITYYSHDLDDGLDSGLLSERRLDAEVQIWHDAARSVQKLHGRLPAECRWYFRDSLHHRRRGAGRGPHERTADPAFRGGVCR